MQLVPVPSARRPGGSILLLAILVLLPACGDGDRGTGEGAVDREPGAEASSRFPEREAPPDPGTIAVEDHEGREVVLEDAPERLLALVPSATAILEQLGARERLVGRTAYDTARALAHLPSVGGGLEPQMEQVSALRPDLVIRFAAESDPETPRQLDRAGIPHLAVRPDGIRDVGEMVQMLGIVTGRQEAAARLWEEVRDSLDAVEERVSHRPRRRVGFLLGGDPPWVAGPGTFLHEILEIAGGENAFADLERLYAPVSVEELVAREVDLFLVLRGSPTPDLPSGVLVRTVPEWVQSPGLRLAEAAREVSRILHPDVPR